MVRPYDGDFHDDEDSMTTIYVAYIMDDPADDTSELMLGPVCASQATAQQWVEKNSNIPADFLDRMVWSDPPFHPNYLGQRFLYWNDRTNDDILAGGVMIAELQP